MGCLRTVFGRLFINKLTKPSCVDKFPLEITIRMRTVSLYYITCSTSTKVRQMCVCSFMKVVELRYPFFATAMKKPSWLDAFFVEKVLRKADDDESIAVSSIIVTPATNKGDNYASDILRVSVKLSRIYNGCKIIETRTVLAKLESEGAATREVVSMTGMFPREMSMMMEILPIMNGMLAKFSSTSLSARCLQVQYETPMYLIIEDLAPRGFRMAELRGNLDLDHCLLAMQNIAVFHAASVALAEKDSKTVRKYQRAIAPFAPFMNASVKTLGEEVVKWPELNPRISEKILKLVKVILQKESEAATFLDDDFNVLNHGDCSSTNMLFRYNEERKPIEQIFVDFQLCEYGTPAMDILYFFGSSTSIDVRLEDRELLVREYHKSLTSNMNKLKCSTEAPSFDNLQDILRKRAFYEVLPSFVGLAYALADINQGKSSEELLTSSKNSYHLVYQGKMYRNVMTRLLPFYDSLGLLDT